MFCHFIYLKDFEMCYSLIACPTNVIFSSLSPCGSFYNNTYNRHTSLLLALHSFLFGIV